MTTKENCDGYIIALIPYFAEIIAADCMTDKDRLNRFTALRVLQGQLARYKEFGYDARLLFAIAEKKGALILKASTKAELEKLKSPRCPHFDGNKFIPDESWVPEEELICWSETSLQGPLNEYGFKRYMELFRMVFPEESKALAI